MDNKEDGDKTGDGTEERHTEQHKSESEIMNNAHVFVEHSFLTVQGAQAVAMYVCPSVLSI